ncbi:MAG: hypothetical protein ACRCVV_18080 [Shewanella sp.]
MSSAALFLVAALATSSQPVANAASIAENEAAVRSQQAQICPPPKPSRHCSNKPCADAEMKRVTQELNDCLARFDRILMCVRTGAPVDICLSQQ